MRILRSFNASVGFAFVRKLNNYSYTNSNLKSVQKISCETQCLAVLWLIMRSDGTDPVITLNEN